MTAAGKKVYENGAATVTDEGDGVYKVTIKGGKVLDTIHPTGHGDAHTRATAEAFADLVSTGPVTPDTLVADQPAGGDGR